MSTAKACAANSARLLHDGDRSLSLPGFGWDSFHVSSTLAQAAEVLKAAPKPQTPAELHVYLAALAEPFCTPET